jgi:hypothetical protein
MSDRSVGWSAPDGSRLDVTPDHAWECADAGGGAIVIAGEGWLTWRGGRDAVRVEAPEVHRVAVAGGLVAGATASGHVLVWPDLEDSPAAQRAQVRFEPDDLVCDAAGGRLIVSGWLDDADAVMTVLDVRGDEPVEVVPWTPWPAQATGVTRALADGMLGVATSDAVLLVSPDGRVGSAMPVAGIERIVGSGSELAWVRISGGRERPVIGTARIVGGEIVPGVELPMPGGDRFPHLAFSPEGFAVVVGTSPEALTVYRLTKDGWSEPIRHDLPRRATPPGDPPTIHR